MMASPMYLSIVPSRSRMASVIGVRYSLRKWVSSDALNPSEMVVNDRMSQKSKRQLALQAAELEGARHFRKARDHGGRDKSAEGGTDLTLLMALHCVERRDPGKIDRSGGKRGIGRLDQQSVTGKREPAHGDDRGKHGARRASAAR